MQTNEINVTDVIKNSVSEEFYTPWSLNKVHNEVFKRLSINKTLPPQMHYQYASKGMINKVKGSKKFTKNEVVNFLSKYFERNADKLQALVKK